MPVTLAQAKLNAQDDLDMLVIDEFRKSSAILDALTFHDAVNPSGGGATLTYGYHRLITQPTADFRAINNEYTPSEVTEARYTTDLKVLGGSFQIDRVLAGVAAGAEVTLQMGQKIKATRTRFQDEVINGDSDVDTNGFDGLDKALAGSSTEMVPDPGNSKIADWTSITSVDDTPHMAMDLLDEFLALMDGEPTMIIGNKKALAKVRSVARRAGYYSRDRNDFGQSVERYGNVSLVDPGDKAGSTDPIVPIETRYDKWTVTVTATGGTYTLTVDGHTTAAIAYNANDSAIKSAVEALPNVGTVAVSSKAITFTPLVVVTVDDSAATGGDVTIAGSNKGGGGLTDLYAVRFGLDGFHGVSVTGGHLVNTWMPDFTTSGAVKTGEVEMGPVTVALKATKAAAVIRNLKVQ